LKAALKNAAQQIEHAEISSHVALRASRRAAPALERIGALTEQPAAPKSVDGGVEP